MKKEDVEFLKFEKVLFSINLKKKKHRWSSVSFESQEVALNYWDSLSLAAKIRLVSSKRWNHYPVTSYSEHSKKRFGSIVLRIVDRLVNKYDEKEVSALSKKAEGVFALCFIDKLPSSFRLKMAKRLKTSKDSRVRTRCARILPASQIRDMVEDKSYNVRNIAITRIGFDNCYSRFVPRAIKEPLYEGDKSTYIGQWYAGKAIRHADKSEVTHLIDQAKTLDPEDVKSLYMLTEVIRKCSAEEALYLLNLSKANRWLDSALREKFGND